MNGRYFPPATTTSTQSTPSRTTQPPLLGSRGDSLRRENSLETLSRNHYGLTHCLQTLEDDFSGLNVGSSPYLGLGGDGYGGSGRDQFMGSFRQPVSSEYNDGGGNLGLEFGYGSDTFTTDPYLTNGYYSSGSRQPLIDERLLINSSPLLQRGVIPCSNSNETFWDSYYGVENPQKLDLSGRSVLRQSRDRPHWLEEPPLDCLSVESVRGRVVHLAKDQSDCKILQKTIDVLTSEEEIEVILREVLEDLFQLVMDPSGNYVVQTLVPLCSEEQRTRILLVLTNTIFGLAGICLNNHGTRVVQKLLEHLTNRLQISIVMKALCPFAAVLSKNTNGHHVIQHCIKHFSEKDNELLFNVLANHCIQVATDKTGCCVLQLCVEYSRGEVREHFLAEIIANAILLAEDRYGQLEGNYVSLSFNKFGSNVVEKCLKESDEIRANKIVGELLRDAKFAMLLVDPYGNYVIQSALLVSKGLVRQTLTKHIEMKSQMMRSNLYGKKILASLEKRKLQIQRT
ncbi:Coatomer beta subunit [Trema orientale]|uniref:Coatomer beta subunit n=1 Tax=Trema orientale TaxID=63057 RepID=A0A2P5EZU8_TREOI|nr:Coatomer beta subunit [Trema orientale]